jgi:hypothetical protein
MVLSHVWGLFAQPEKEWKAIRDEKCTITRCFCSHVLFLAAIPAISGYIGTTQIGWQIGTGPVVKLTTQSALTIAVLFYLAMLVAVFTIGRLICWMGETYGAKQRTFSQCVALAAYTATPLFLSGIMLLYPVLWLNMLIGMVALAYTVYLLYTGVPVMMGIPKERGFLYSSAVLAVGLVMLVAMLAATVLLWGMGIGPVFTSA